MKHYYLKFVTWLSGRKTAKTDQSTSTVNSIPEPVAEITKTANVLEEPVIATKPIIDEPVEFKISNETI